MMSLNLFSQLVERGEYKVLPELPDGGFLLSYDIAEVILRVNHITVNDVDLSAGARYISIKPKTKNTLLFRRLTELVELHGGAWDDKKRRFLMPTHRDFAIYQPKPKT